MLFKHKTTELLAAVIFNARLVGFERDVWWRGCLVLAVGEYAFL